MCRVLQAKLLIFFPGNLLTGNRTVVRAEEISKQGGHMGADCKRFTDWGDVSGVAGGLVSPAIFCKTYPQPYPQPVDSPVDGQQRGRARRPHIVNFSAGGPYTPQKEIFAKVRSVNMALTCGYRVCGEGHTSKVGNGLNFLPYI